MIQLPFLCKKINQSLKKGHIYFSNPVLGASIFNDSPISSILLWHHSLQITSQTVFSDIFSIHRYQYCVCFQIYNC